MKSAHKSIFSPYLFWQFFFATSTSFLASTHPHAVEHCCHRHHHSHRVRNFHFSNKQTNRQTNEWKKSLRIKWKTKMERQIMGCVCNCYHQDEYTSINVYLHKDMYTLFSRFFFVWSEAWNGNHQQLNVVDALMQLVSHTHTQRTQWICSHCLTHTQTSVMPHWQRRGASEWANHVKTTN